MDNLKDIGTFALIDYTFRNIFPDEGMTVREGQRALSFEMMDALLKGETTLCDAGVGIGKTYAYLVALAIWLDQQPEGVTIPAVISTSSIALQKAILKEYLPFINRVLLAENMIHRPITAVLRKGKEHYVCDRRLAMRLAQIKKGSRKPPRQRAALQTLRTQLDMDEVSGLSAYDRALVCVPEICSFDCPARSYCRYQNHLKSALQDEVSIQICNHNYLLADANHRAQGRPRLLQPYGALVVDEAHKLPEAARQMMCRESSLQALESLCDALKQEGMTRSAQALRDRFKRLFAMLQRDGNGYNDRAEEQAVTFAANAQQRKALKAAVNALQTSARNLDEEIPQWLSRQMVEAAETLGLFLAHERQHVLYIRYERDGTAVLCAADRNVPANLRQTLWASGVPAILTSGTLAAGGHFDPIQKSLGLYGDPKVRTFAAGSPFSYKENCLLYFPAAAKQKPDAEQLAQQINDLLTASNGHALVLFTSYHEMWEVCTKLESLTPFPLLPVWRNGQRTVEQFKKLPNAVLCAAGPCWEGMDFPGDMVSLLVIVRLPFPVPDPVSEAERKDYPDLKQYIRAVALPEMQKRLRQGFGRALRTESDTCAVAILDPRAAPNGRYHRAVLEALPDCGRAESIEDIEQFYRAHKGPDYFMPCGGEPK